MKNKLQNICCSPNVFSHFSQIHCEILKMTFLRHFSTNLFNFFCFQPHSFARVRITWPIFCAISSNLCPLQAQCVSRFRCKDKVSLLTSVVLLLLLLLLHSTVKYDNIQAEYIKYLTTHKNGFKKLYF